MSQVRLSDFPRVFWIANVMELFERGAYYGLNSVLAVYLAGSVATGGLGFDQQAVGFLQGIIYAAIYVIPILGGVLADRYGYRRMLLIAFALLSTGYALAGQMQSYALVFSALAVMAVGAGLFKPIISGTIARTTDARTSTLGFGIFYWMINLGALIAPLVVTALRARSWSYVFGASAIYIALMFVPAIFLFKDPPRPESTKSLREALLGGAEVLRDARFMLMIVVYSCFWILYFQNFSTTLWYLGDFVNAEPVSRAVTSVLNAVGIGYQFKLDAEHVTSINAGTIVLLQYFISRAVKDRPALPTMMTGMSIGALGFLLLGSSQNAWIFILGITVFSIGEMTAHPKYISFVGLIAPADRKAVYMGYAFLYGVFGSLLGSNIGAVAYKTFLKPLVGQEGASKTIALFWGAFALLDVVAVVGLWRFAKAFGEDTAQTRPRARVVMAGVYALLLVVGLAFLARALTRSPVEIKTAVQASLFILLGGGGLWMSLSGAKETTAAPSA